MSDGFFNDYRGITYYDCSTCPDSDDIRKIRVYLNRRELDDSLVAKHVTPKDIVESSEYVEAFAASLGIAAKDIAIPTPYKVQKQATFYCYMLVCQRKAMYTSGKDVEEDAFALKYKMYQRALNDMEASIGGGTYTSGVPSAKRKFPMSVGMVRR